MTCPWAMSQDEFYVRCREFREESYKRSGTELDKTELVDETVIIGYYRDLCRGGKPDFLGLSRLGVISNLLTPDGREVTNTEETRIRRLVMRVEDLRREVDDLLTKEVDRLSVPLWLLLITLSELIETHPKLVKNSFDTDFLKASKERRTR